MRLSGVFAILKKDLIHGPKTFIFIQAVATPIFCALLVSILFGSFLSGKPRVGFLFEGNTEIKEQIEIIDFIRFTEYESLEKMKTAVQTGRLDMGISIPSGFDQDVRSGGPAYIKSYVWGESLLKNRALIFAGLSDLFIDLAGKEIRVDVKTVTVGDGEIKPLSQRFLPLLVLLAVMMSGLMIPSSTLVDEKQRQTLTAMTVTPVTFEEVVLAKSLLGFIISLCMGTLILVLNRSFGANPPLLMLTLAMAAAFASACGGLAGVLVGNINSLMTLFKSVMLFMYAPAILKLFPKVPDWLAKLFPTYYVFYPVVQVSQNNARAGDIGFELIILTGIIVLMSGVVILAGKRKKVQVA